MQLPSKDFDRPWLLLCEGLSDKQFFHQIITYRNICIGRFNIYFPSRYGQHGGGKGKFGNWLETIYATSQSFRDNVEAVLLVADNDVDMAASFSDIQAALRQAGFPIPNAEKEVASKRHYPHVVVLMLPMGKTGNLETLCIEAGYNRWKIKSALDKYVAGVPAAGWDVGKQSKMRLHAMLAATCEVKPDISFAHIWQEREQYHLPLDDPCFNDLVAFLAEFDSLLQDV